MTFVILALTWLYFGLCIARWANPQSVPFEVLLWGGLILIFAWWAHDAAHNRKVERDAYRTREVVG